MGIHVANVARQPLSFFRPPGDTHITHPLKLGTLLHQQRGAMDFTDKDGGFEELHLPRRGHRGFDPSTTDKGIGMDRAFHHAVFADNDLSFRVYVAFQSPINAYRAVDPDFTLQLNTLRQQRNIAVVAIPGLLHGTSPVQANRLYKST